MIFRRGGFSTLPSFAPIEGQRPLRISGLVFVMFRKFRKALDIIHNFF